MSKPSIAHEPTPELSEAEWLQERLASLIAMAELTGMEREHADPARRESMEATLRSLGPQIQRAREALAALGEVVPLCPHRTTYKPTAHINAVWQAGSAGRAIESSAALPGVRRRRMAG